MTRSELLEAFTWGVVVVTIGGGWALGLDPRACAPVLLVVVAALYFWGRP